MAYRVDVDLVGPTLSDRIVSFAANISLHVKKRIRCIVHTVIARSNQLVAEGLHCVAYVITCLQKLPASSSHLKSVLLQRGRIACNAERCISHGNSARLSVTCLLYTSPSPRD